MACRFVLRAIFALVLFPRRLSPDGVPRRLEQATPASHPQWLQIAVHVDEGELPLHTFRVDEVVIASVCCYRHHSLFLRAPAMVDAHLYVDLLHTLAVSLRDIAMPSAFWAPASPRSQRPAANCRGLIPFGLSMPDEQELNRYKAPQPPFHGFCSGRATLSPN